MTETNERGRSMRAFTMFTIIILAYSVIRSINSGEKIKYIIVFACTFLQYANYINVVLRGIYVKFNAKLESYLYSIVTASMLYFINIRDGINIETSTMIIRIIFIVICAILTVDLSYNTLVTIKSDYNTPEQEIGDDADEDKQ